MVSVIAQNRQHEFLSFKHLGFVKDGMEDTDGERVRNQAPAFEEYVTRVWPRGSAKLKQWCKEAA